MEATKHKLKTILDIAIGLSKETDNKRMLNIILDKSMELSNCDAGTLYIMKDNHLHFMLMKTLSMGINSGMDEQEINMPPVPLCKEKISAYAAMTAQPISIPDVYRCDEFDFNGPMKYDMMTGYHTQSILSVPLVEQEGNVIGVIQLINSMDEAGNIVPFSKQIEEVIFALSSLAAIELANLRYLTELKEQMWSFTEAMAEIIDNRTPYNANHIRNVAKYSERLADYINALHEKGEEENFFDEKRRDTLVMSALLHDIGKMLIPTRIMNKPTRLGERYGELLTRFEIIGCKYRILNLEGRLSQEEYLCKTRQLGEIKALVEAANTAGRLEEDTLAELKEVFPLKYQYGEETIPYFTEEDITCLSVCRGTLTAEERSVMQSHVELTDKILEKVHFNAYFKNCRTFAVQHHEYLNGSGYPNGLTAEELPLESRILAVADIYDALRATDRPYKKPMSHETAINILMSMAANGELDEKLCRYLAACAEQKEIEEIK